MVVGVNAVSPKTWVHAFFVGCISNYQTRDSFWKFLLLFYFFLLYFLAVSVLVPMETY